MNDVNLVFSKISEGWRSSPHRVKPQPRDKDAASLKELVYNPDEIVPFVIWITPDDLINAAIRPLPARTGPDRIDYDQVGTLVCQTLRSLKNGTSEQGQIVLDRALAVLEQTIANQAVLQAARHAWLGA